MTADELKDLKKSIIEGITLGMGKIPMEYNGKNIGDPNGPNYDADARKAFLDNLATQNKQDKLNEIERMIASIDGSTKLGAKKIEELKEAKERIENGGISENDEKKYRAKRIATVANAVANIGKGIINIFIAFGERDIALKKAYLEKQSQIIQIGIERESKITSQSTKAIVSGFSKNTADMAYDATQYGYELTKTSAKTAMDLKIAEKTYTKNVKQANMQFGATLIASGTAIGASIGTAIAGPVGTVVGGVIGAIGGFIGHAFSKVMGLDIKQMQLEIQKQEMVSKAMQGYYEQMQNFAQPWDELRKQTTDFVLKINDAGLKFGATIGYIGDKFGDTMIDMSQQTLTNGSNLAKMFGKEAEKIPEYMDSYISTSGRAVGMNANDIGNMMATGRLFGMSGTESANLYGSMNVFNTSISSASDTMGVMYHQITRMGLSSKKFGKELVQNLKMAEKYNFKGGVDNMMKLTKWAQQTRFNLSSAASFSDSIMNDSLSGALEKSAKLQVLGGAAAIYSDPFGMLYDAGADVGNMAQRMAAMFSDITGTFNKKTGETVFDWQENKMIAERARALGMDFGEAKNIIRQNKKQGVINKVLKGSGLDEEDKLAIGNRATYNRKKGTWEVTDIHGETHDIREYGKAGGPDINDLLPADTDEAILTVAEKSLTHLENLDNAVVNRYTKLGNEKKETIYGTVDEQRKLMDNFYQENWGKISVLWDYANQYSKDMLNAQIDMMKIATEKPTLLQDIYTAFKETSYDFILTEKGLKDFTWAIGEAKEGVDKFADALYKKMEKEKNKNNQTDYNVIMNKASQQIDQGNYIAGGALLLNANATTLQKDGYGSTNGGMILGASNVKSINDGAVNVKTSNRDQYLAAETGGPIDILLKQILPGLKMLVDNSGTNGSSNGTANINFGGKIELSQDGTSINLVDLIKNNPSVATQFINILAKAMDINKNGKSTVSGNYKI